MFKVVRKEFQFGSEKFVLETGKVARQATAAVMVTTDSTSVLVTVVAKKEADPGKDFLPLTVNCRKNSMPPAVFPAASISVKVVLPRRKP